MPSPFGGKTKLALDEDIGKGLAEKGTLRGSWEWSGRTGPENESWAWRPARQSRGGGQDSSAVWRVHRKGEDESIGKCLPWYSSLP